MGGRARGDASSRCAPCATGSAALVPRRTPTGRLQSLRSVDHEQHPLFGIQAARPSPTKARSRRSRSRSSPPTAERDLHALGGDPQGDDHHPALTPVRRASSPPNADPPAGVTSARPAPGGCAPRRSGHRRLRRRPGLDLDLLADRFLRAPVPTGRDAGEHPLQHDPTERIAFSEMLIGRQRTSASPSALRTRGRSTSTRRPPSVTSPSSWPCRTATRSGSCLPFGPTTSSTSSSISSVNTPSPTPTLSANSPSFAAPTSSPNAPEHAPEARPPARSPQRPVRCYSRRFLLRSLPDHHERSQQEQTRPEGPPSPQSSTGGKLSRRPADR